ncbi:appr-1-p processing domain protein [Richelia sinica FACHB-800]|uniref:Appr-1-p processing domain protein n=1 Tax=Richelia sinica FACHB-800 TaxID=1357546 RepID=A0A975T4K7_9NOST|nr:Hpt domain-containing protein [Richelia sinica]MBD2663115.1 Hpt domain-containing protein [Richelia sinica FACHB-800]QXE21985.1 appr-1-p processing domain protein [Richelia sinica FACHB-800]
MQSDIIPAIKLYFFQEAQKNLNTIYEGILNIQDTIDHSCQLNTLFRATFSLKGGASMLGYTQILKIIYRLEQCFGLLRYPIQADEAIQLLFLDVYHIIQNLILQIQTPEGLNAEKALNLALKIDPIFTILNSHLLFLIEKSNYKAKIVDIEASQNWKYDIPLKLILVDTQAFLCRTFEDYFTGLPNVEIINGSFEELPFFDCIVTAASSVATINDIDSRIVQFFGEDVINLLQQRIQQEYLGEQPIGTSLIVETNHALHPFLAHTPTLRMQIARAGRDHVYQGMWSTLLAIRKHNQKHSHCLQKQINIVAIPGLGTAVGRVSIDEVARQMSMAYQNFLYSSLSSHYHLSSCLLVD